MYMMKDPKLILNLLFFFCLVACGDGTSVSPLLIEAEKYMNERPDSALLLLDSIAHPENLSPGTKCSLVFIVDSGTG